MDLSFVIIFSHINGLEKAVLFYIGRRIWRSHGYCDFKFGQRQ